MASPRHPTLTPLPTYPRKTRVGGSRRCASGRLSRRSRRSRGITPGSRACGYKTASGRRQGVQTDPNGLLYMRARYYNPYLCRFLNPDPTGFSGGLNWFAYANGNPVSYTDPLGLQSWMSPGYGSMPNPVNIVPGNMIATTPDPSAYFAQGLVVGAVGAGAIVVAAPVLVAVGVPASVVTGGLLVTGGAGAVATGYSIYENPSPNNIAFNLGGLGGGLLVGGASANYIDATLSPAGYQPGPVSLASDISMAWRDSSGNINPLAFLSDWLLPGATVGPMSTGPSVIGAASTIGGVGGGTAAGVDWLGNPISSSSTGKPH